MSWQELKEAVLGSDIKTLVSLGASVSQCRSRSDNQNALHVAVQHEKMEVIDFLLCKHPMLLQDRDRMRYNPFDYAYEKNQLSLMQRCLTICPDLSTCERTKHDSCLHRAVEENKTAIVQMIFEQSPELSVSKGDELLLHSALYADVDMVKYILTKIPRRMISNVNGNGDNALHVAVRRGKMDIVQLLTETHAMLVRYPNRTRLTPFLLAVAQNQVAIVDFFLRNCPNVSSHSIAVACSDLPKNALFLTSNAHIMQSLLRAKPSLIDGLAESKDTPLHYAIRFCDNSCVSVLFAAKPTLIAARNNMLHNPLEVAFHQRRYDLVSFFLEVFPKVKCSQIEQNSTLHIAVRCCTSDVVNQVLTHHAKSIHCTNRDGLTPFLLAVHLAKIDAANVLLPHATTDMIAKTNKKEQFYAYVETQLVCLKHRLLPVLLNIVLQYLKLKKKKIYCKPKNKSFVFEFNNKKKMSWAQVQSAILASNLKELKDFGNDVVNSRDRIQRGQKTSLQFAIAHNKRKVVKFLLCNYPQLLDIEDNINYNVLDYAMIHGNLHFIEPMLKIQPNLVEKKHPRFGTTALQRAACGRRLLEVQMMLGQKPDAIASLNAEGETLLHLVTKTGMNVDVAMLQYLLSVAPKALVSVKNKNGWTALHFATQACNITMVQMLSEADSSVVDVMDSDFGMTPFLYALDHDQVKIVDYFLSAHPNVIHHCKAGSTLNAFFFAQTSFMRQKLLDLQPSLVTGVDANHRTPLHWTLRCRDQVCTHLVFQIKPDLMYANNEFGESPLGVAFESVQYNFVNMFLQYDASVQDMARDLNNTLHMAVTCCTRDVVSKVVQHHPYFVNCINMQGQTPFQLAVMLDNLDSANVLLPHATTDMIAKISKRDYADFYAYLEAQFECLNESLLPELRKIVLHYLTF